MVIFWECNEYFWSIILNFVSWWLNTIIETNRYFRLMFSKKCRALRLDYLKCIPENLSKLLDKQQFMKMEWFSIFFESYWIIEKFKGSLNYLTYTNNHQLQIEILPKKNWWFASLINHIFMSELNYSSCQLRFKLKTWLLNSDN